MCSRRAKSPAAFNAHAPLSYAIYHSRDGPENIGAI